MIITIFGDVHGNIIALEKLFQLENKKTDLFLCHGDIVNYGPWSNECVQLLDTIPNCIISKGNHELFFINGTYNGKNIIANSFFDFCFKSFNKSLVNIISKYYEKIEIDSYTIKHTINNQYIFTDTDLSNLNLDSNYIIGHSHQQYQRKNNDFTLTNTGSLGQNRQYINLSCYLQLDTKTNKIELKSFKHNIHKVISHMKSLDYPTICVDYYLSKKLI